MADKSLEFTPEQKAKVEVHIKAACVSLISALEEASLAVAQNTENKIDDIVVPVLAPTAKQALIDLIGGLKL
jgi:hypothetical protein